MTLCKSSVKRLYIIPVLSKALDLFELMQSANKSLTLEEIHRKSGISKTTAYRVLKTFVHRGYVSQSPDGQYRQISRPKKMRFGFARQSAEMPFSIEVTKSLQRAASAFGVDLMVLDNQYDRAKAIHNANIFIENHVDLVIEFQMDQEAAPVIADKIAKAGIPLIAIDIPHPHATYFGVDNFQVGRAAGELLAQHAVRCWKGRVDWIVGLEIPGAGQLVQSRITGAFEALRESLPDLPIESFVRVDGGGMRDCSKKTILDFLQRHPDDRHILIAAASDTSALGAVDAARNAERVSHVAIVGQDGIQEAVEEMRCNASPLISSVSHEANSYGPRIIDLGLLLLHGQSVPPYNYAAHTILTCDSIT